MREWLYGNRASSNHENTVTIPKEDYDALIYLAKSDGLSLLLSDIRDELRYAETHPNPKEYFDREISRWNNITEFGLPWDKSPSYRLTIKMEKIV